MMFFGLSMLMFHFSLFFTDQDLVKIDHLENAYSSNKIQEQKGKNKLILQGILYRPDLQTWTVWINDTCISSRNQKSIKGWVIVSVSQDSVVLVSPSGQKQELHLNQYSDDKDQSETIFDDPQNTLPQATESLNEEDEDEDEDEGQHEPQDPHDGISHPLPKEQVQESQEHSEPQESEDPKEQVQESQEHAEPQESEDPKEQVQESQEIKGLEANNHPAASRTVLPPSSVLNNENNGSAPGN
jgi:hypothetical protein